MSQKALVALVGRPNVGKSTLFNRIVGKRLAVVSEVAGTTRDRLYADADWAGTTFTVVDTGGIEVTEGRNTDPLSEDSEQFLPLIRQQANIAIQDADVIVHVVDGQAGLTAADKEVAAILRQTKKPVIIAANKLESANLRDNAFEFYELALGSVFPISALHGSGSGDLLDATSTGLAADASSVAGATGKALGSVGWFSGVTGGGNCSPVTVPVGAGSSGSATVELRVVMPDRRALWQADRPSVASATVTSKVPLRIMPLPLNSTKAAKAVLVPTDKQ